MVRAVRVGVALPEAIRRVARESPVPTAAIFSRIADEMAIGTPLHQAMAGATGSTGLAEYRFFATALILQSRAGGGLTADAGWLGGRDPQARGGAGAGQRAGRGGEGERRHFVGAARVHAGGACGGEPDLCRHAVQRGRRAHAVLAAACGTEIMGIMVMRAMIRRALS